MIYCQVVSRQFLLVCSEIEKFPDLTLSEDSKVAFRQLDRHLSA